MLTLPAYKPTWMSVARIAFAAIFFLWLAGKLVPLMPENIPFTAAAKNSPVIPMLTMGDDRRGVRADITVQDGKKRIAWITDSAGIIIPAEKNWGETSEEETRLDSAEVAKVLGNDDYSIELYAQIGTRPINALAYVLQALKDKPDLIVMPINPIWGFSSYRILSRRQYLNMAPQLWAQEPALWPLIPLFASPSQNLWAAAASHLPILYDASRFKGYAQQKISGSFPAQGGAPAVRFDVPATIESTFFWLLSYASEEEKQKVLMEDGLSQRLKIYRILVQRSFIEDNRGFGTALLEDTLRILKDSGTPALIYLSPLHEGYYQDEVSREKIAEMTAFLSKKGDELKGTNITIIPEVPKQVRDSIPFREDGFHFNDMGDMDKYMAQQIKQALKQGGTHD